MALDRLNPFSNTREFKESSGYYLERLKKEGGLSRLADEDVKDHKKLILDYFPESKGLNQHLTLADARVPTFSVLWACIELRKLSKNSKAIKPADLGLIALFLARGHFTVQQFAEHAIFTRHKIDGNTVRGVRQTLMKSVTSREEKKLLDAVITEWGDLRLRHQNSMIVNSDKEKYRESEANLLLSSVSQNLAKPKAAEHVFKAVQDFRAHLWLDAVRSHSDHLERNDSGEHLRDIKRRLFPEPHVPEASAYGELKLKRALTGLR
ncbi:MAG: hypothetical protein V1811_00275 [Candidatus Micrarchaeota archaeon]